MSKFRKRKRKLLSCVPVLDKREFRHFHVVVMQWRYRNVQKSVMHVQSCPFAVLVGAPFCVAPGHLLFFNYCHFYWDAKREPPSRKEILPRLDIICTRKKGRPETESEYCWLFRISSKERVGPRVYYWDHPKCRKTTKRTKQFAVLVQSPEIISAHFDL